MVSVTQGRDCLLPSCASKVVTAGFCDTHRGRTDIQAALKFETRCAEGDCPTKVASRGLCDLHYRRRKRSGTLPPKNRDLGCTWPEYCDRPFYARGFCSTHYNYVRSEFGLTPTKRKCSIDDCERFSTNKGLCSRHYGQSNTYKVPPKELNELLKSNCGICGKGGDDRVIDHDHSCCPGAKSCGKCVRGILCRTCNSALGLLKEDPNMLRRAVEYLEETRITSENGVN